MTQAIILRGATMIALLLTAGCVCTTGSASSGPGGARPVSHPPPPPPAQPVFYKFIGPHPTPGGGWDTTSGRHTHDYPPAPMSGYKRDGEWHVWIGGNDARGGANSANTSTTRTPTGSGNSSDATDSGDRGRRDKKDKKDEKDKDRRGKRDKDDDEDDGRGRRDE